MWYVIPALKFLTRVCKVCDDGRVETKLTSPFALLKQSWSLGLSRPNVSSYLFLGVIPQLVSFAVSALVSYASGTTDIQTTISGLLTNTGGWAIAGVVVVGLGGLVLMSFLSVWYTALLYKVYQATVVGNLSRLSTYIRPAREITGRLLMTYIMVGLFTLGGFLLFIIPGIMLAVRYSFAPLVAAVEDRSAKPIEESKRLVRGRFWKLVGRSLLLIFAYNIPLSILQAVHPYLGALWAITSPIFGLYFYLVYQDFKRTAAVPA